VTWLDSVVWFFKGWSAHAYFLFALVGVTLLVALARRHEPKRQP
jgi:hypothetical protein